MSLERTTLFPSTPACSQQKQPHADVLTLYNVPETNLSTAEEHMDTCSDINQNIDKSLGLNWKFGMVKLPGSNLQLRMDENGDVEVLENEHKEELQSVMENKSNDEPLQTFTFAADTSVKPNRTDSSDNLQTDRDVFSKTKSEGDNVEANNESTINGLKDPTRLVSESDHPKCDFCGKLGTRQTFLGRFCSKVCIGKNASKQRKIRIMSGELPRYRKKQRFSQDDKSSVTETGKLKIRIRLPSSPASQLPRNATDSITSKTFNSKHRDDIDALYHCDTDIDQPFVWEDYLTSTKSRPVPVETFELSTGVAAFPSRSNPFQVGWYLEAVDPVHQSLICLTTVAQVQGHRLRLHFEGYHDCYDVWVNADSCFLFPCGFCESSGRILTPPKGYSQKNFILQEYIEHNHFVAPKEVFSQFIYSNTSGFTVGDKLEAVDRKHHELTCTATVVDAISDYVLIHFDGWEKSYDYWAHISSPFIRPVGWCSSNGKELSPPLQHDLTNVFSWDEYLKKTSSVAALPSCFKSKPHQYEVGTKLEVVDQRNPILVRVATICEVNDLRIKVHFDRWRKSFDAWFDVDSVEIHPMHWCSKTNHPLQNPVHIINESRRPCPIDGCNGLGHANTPKVLSYHRKHHSDYGCPYSKQNFNNHTLYDRFAVQQSPRDPSHSWTALKEDSKKHRKPGKRKYFSRSNSSMFPMSSDKTRGQQLFESFKLNSHRRLSNVNKDFSQNSTRSRQLRYNRHVNSLRDHRHLSSLDKDLVKSSLISSLAAFSSVHLPQCWNTNVKHLPGVEGVKASDVSKWSSEKVASFIRNLTGNDEYGDLFIKEEIDGEAWLLLTQNDISKVLKIKLGPAVKIYNAALFFKVSENDHDSDFYDAT